MGLETIKDDVLPSPEALRTALFQNATIFEDDIIIKINNNMDRLRRKLAKQLKGYLDESGTQVVDMTLDSLFETIEAQLRADWGIRDDVLKVFEGNAEATMSLVEVMVAAGVATIKDDVLASQDLVEYALTSEYSQQLIDPKIFYKDAWFTAKAQSNTIRDMIIQTYTGIHDKFKEKKEAALTDSQTIIVENRRGRNP
jgi:hypothetical protein